MKKTSKKPEMVKVKSSNIDSVGYDETNRGLYVKFHNEKMYHYAPVEPQRHKAMMIAKSIGTFFNQYIKGNGQINVTKL